MKITKGDVGRKIFVYPKQDWGQITLCSETEKDISFLIIINGWNFKVNERGLGYCEDVAPIVFWHEVKPIEHKERPVKTVKSKSGLVLYRNHCGEIRETPVCYTEKSFNDFNLRNKREIPFTFVCFSPDKPIEEVDEEVEE